MRGKYRKKSLKFYGFHCQTAVSISPRRCCAMCETNFAAPAARSGLPAPAASALRSAAGSGNLRLPPANAKAAPCFPSHLREPTRSTCGSALVSLRAPRALRSRFACFGALTVSLHASEPFGFLGGRRTRRAVSPFLFFVDNQMFNMFCRDAQIGRLYG